MVSINTLVYLHHNIQKRLRGATDTLVLFAPQHPKKWLRGATE